MRNNNTCGMCGVVTPLVRLPGGLFVPAVRACVHAYMRRLLCRAAQRVLWRHHNRSKWQGWRHHVSSVLNQFDSRMVFFFCFFFRSRKRSTECLIVCHPSRPLGVAGELGRYRVAGDNRLGLLENRLGLVVFRSNDKNHYGEMCSNTH